MPKLHVKEAYNFYHRFILDYTADKSQVYQAYGFTVQGSVGAKDWEVFAAILVNDRARPGDGADLIHYEVKSAIMGRSFEYQYHRSRGIDKLNEDKSVDHIFITVSPDYSDADVWLVSRQQISSKLEEWLPDLQENYRDESRQRFRRSISMGYIAENGERLMEIRSGKLT